MAFVANLFNNHPGLPPMDEEELEQEEMEPYEETREDLSKCRWLTGLWTLVQLYDQIHFKFISSSFS